MPAAIALQHATLRVLMIEDEGTDALFVQRSLASHLGTRIELVHAGSLGRGVKLLTENDFDAVLLDLSLPDAVRFEGIGKISEIDDEMPIIIVTGLEDPETAQEALARGAQDYLIKGQWEGRHLAHAILHSVARKAAENRLRHAAFHDDLTGLPNRRMLSQRLRALAQTRREKGAHGLLLMGLDGFRAVNDTLGHERGDQLLIQTAERLSDAIGDRGLLVRWSADQFALLVEDLRSVGEARGLADRVHAAMLASFDLSAHSTFASVCVGIATSENGSKDNALLQQASSALHRAKSNGRGSTALYDADMHHQALDRMKLETALREAPIDEFVVRYQPIVHLSDGRLAGFEALVRWRTASGEERTPAQFLDAAEEIGVLRAIHAKVLRDACTFCSGLPEPMTISVNVSQSCFHDARLIPSVRQALRDAGLDASRLVLEITENVLLEDDSVEAILAGLRALGVRIHLDDFGTGSSSLTSLQRFSLDGIKIDRTFVQDAKGRGWGLVRSMAYLASELGLEVVAEGIETGSSAAQIRELEFAFGQGYLFGRPAPPETARALAATWDQKAGLVTWTAQGAAASNGNGHGRARGA